MIAEPLRVEASLTVPLGLLVPAFRRFFDGAPQPDSRGLWYGSRRPNRLLGSRSRQTSSAWVSGEGSGGLRSTVSRDV